MPNFCLSYKRAKVLARMHMRRLGRRKTKTLRLALGLRQARPDPAQGLPDFATKFDLTASGEGANLPPSGLVGGGLQEHRVMKLFTGSLAAGLVLIVSGAQAQVPGPYANGRAPYAAMSDFDAPYAGGPRYGSGPSLLPSIEVYSVLRDNGFSPLGIPRLRGFVYTIAVIDRSGEDGRLVINARNGRIIRFLPGYRGGIFANFNEEPPVMQGTPGAPAAGRRQGFGAPAAIDPEGRKPHRPATEGQPARRQAGTRTGPTGGRAAAKAR